MASSFQFRNVNTYVVEPEGEPIQSLPSKSSLDFSPQSSCIEEAPNDGKQYVRQNESWQEPNKENILGIKITDSPEFADELITPLAVEATYTSTVWTYLVGLFTTVPKSVKEHIVKGWTVIENLKSRISFLENNLILSIALTETVAQLDINLPTSEYDIELEVDFTCATDVAVQASLRINDVSTSNYVAANSQTYSGFVSYVGRHASKGVYRFVLINGFVFYFCDIQQIWGNISTQTVASRSITGFLKDPQTGINKITFAHPVNEGSKFIIRRIKRHA